VLDVWLEKEAHALNLEIQQLWRCSLEGLAMEQEVMKRYFVPVLLQPQEKLPEERLPQLEYRQLQA
jgi:hypothetical protein